MDRLDAMQVLLAVVDEGSLSAASRKLNATLASVSRKIADLEQRLGTRLLIRTSRNIRLTDPGRDFVDAIRQIVPQIDEAVRQVSGEYHEPRGELTITVPTEFGRLVALPLAYRFICEHPQIRLRVLSLERNVDFFEERVDVAIRLGDLADSPLYAVKVGDVGVSTCASPDYLARRGRPLHPADLPDHDGISFDSPYRSDWMFSVDGEKLEAKPQFRVSANTASATFVAAAEGIGIVRALTFMVHDSLQSGVLVRILEDFEMDSRPVHILYARQGLLPLKVRAFIDWMAPRLRQRLKEISTCGERTISHQPGAPSPPQPPTTNPD